MVVDERLFQRPPAPAAERPALIATHHTPALPELPTLAERIEAPVLLTLGDNVSTDDIMPAGARVLPLWSDVPASAAFTFEALAPDYPARARACQNGHIILAGHNYGQGSSRENAALVPRYLGLEAVIAKSFARIHWQNLAGFGVLALTLVDEADFERIAESGAVTIEAPAAQLAKGGEIEARLADGSRMCLAHRLSERQREVLKAGGVINRLREKRAKGR